MIIKINGIDYAEILVDVFVERRGVDTVPSILRTINERIVMLYSGWIGCGDKPRCTRGKIAIPVSEYDTIIHELIESPLIRYMGGDDGDLKPHKYEEDKTTETLQHTEAVSRILLQATERSERSQFEMDQARFFNPHAFFQDAQEVQPSFFRCVHLTDEEISFMFRRSDRNPLDANGAGGGALATANQHQRLDANGAGGDASLTANQHQASGTRLTDEQLRALGFSLPDVTTVAGAGASSTTNQDPCAAVAWEDVSLGINYIKPVLLSPHVERKREMFDDRGYKSTEDGTLRRVVLKQTIQEKEDNSGCCRIC